MVNINIKILCTAIALFIIIYTPQILHSYPIIKILFNDKINYILLIAVVVFVMLIELYYGLILGLIILYISFYITDNQKKMIILQIKVNK